MATWQELDEELDAWQQTGKPATFWWRDDDAASLTPQLRKLVEISDAASVPLHLAVIPAKLEPPAVSYLQKFPNVRILQHGFAHTDHAPSGEGSWELGDHRPLKTTLAELHKGRQILLEAFANQFLPVVVPPWTRITEKLFPLLPTVGITCCSGEGVRGQKTNNGYVKIINTHCDPIKWKNDARFKGDERVLDDFVGHLKMRRMGECDPHEPTGLCTHHLDHSDKLWQFLEHFVNHVKTHAGASWIFLDGELK